MAHGWQTASDLAPHLFDSCVNQINQYYGVPVNGDSLLGYQVPRSGSSYAGLNVYFDNVSDIREYLRFTLTNSLQINKRYCLSFYVNLNNTSRYSIDAIGAYFTSDSTIYCSSIPCRLNLVPQVSNTPGNILNDTLGWIKVSGCFTAGENIKYLIIGNFLPDSLVQKDTNRFVPTWDYSTYYYLDDVSLELDTLMSVNESRDRKPEIQVLPNPARDEVFLSATKPVSIEKIEFSNLYGTKVFIYYSPTIHSTFDLSFLAAGCYSYKIFLTNMEVVIGKILRIN